METAPAAARLRAVPVAAHVRHHSGGRPRRPAAGALAVRPGEERGVHLRRQESLGGELGDLAGLRPTVGQHFPRSAAACAAERRRPPISIAPQRAVWWIITFRRMCRSRRRFRTFTRMGPNGFQAPLKVSKVAAGHYRGSLAIGQNQGLFRVRPVADSPRLSGGGFLPAGRRDAGVRQQSRNCCGRLRRPPAGATIRRRGRYSTRRGAAFGHVMDLWPGLLALAILLNLAELVLRKWKGLLEALHLRPATA